MNFFDDMFTQSPFFIKEQERDYYIKLHGIEYVEWLDSQNIAKEE